MHLYLVRHGQSEANAAGTSIITDSSLTILGRSQAEEVARRLAPEGIDLIICSPMRRALQTASALQRRTGAPVEVWRDLVEFRSQAPFRHLGHKGIAEICPGAMCDEDLPEDGFDLGNEVVQDVHARAVRMAQRLHSRFAETDLRIVLYAHAGFNSFFLSALFGHPLNEGFFVQQNNCCVNRLRIEPNHTRLLSVNETAHLTHLT